jgi:hypothetical protein
VFGLPVHGLRVLGGLTLLDAEQRRTAGGLNDGKDAIGVPGTQLNLGADWDVPQVAGLSLNARAVHTSRQYADAANAQKLPSWTRLDLGATYATRVLDRDVTVRARVDNAFGRNYWASAGGYPGYAAHGNRVGDRRLLSQADVDGHAHPHGERRRREAGGVRHQGASALSFAAAAHEVIRNRGDRERHHGHAEPARPAEPARIAVAAVPQEAQVADDHTDDEVQLRGGVGMAGIEQARAGHQGHDPQRDTPMTHRGSLCAAGSSLAGAVRRRPTA